MSGKSGHIKGQGTVEYLLVIAITILVLFFFVRPGGRFQESYKGVAEEQGVALANVANHIFK